jgi:UDP-glucose 4-epimerase
VIGAVEKVGGRAVPARIVGRRAGDPAVLVAASDKLRLETGWSPRYADIEDIVRHAWIWREAHPEGYGGRD